MDLNLTYFGKGIAKTQLKRDHKAMLLASIQAGVREPSQGMTKEDAITILSQDIADYDEILARFRNHDASRGPAKRRPTARKTEAIVGAENWHEERDRLVQLIRGIESGKITHVDEADLRELRATSPQNIAVLKARLALLNDRLGDDKA